MAHKTLKIHTENILPIIKKWLYSDKDIFIRELVSNSCDALRKLQILGKAEDPRIDITLDKTAKTITISDNGIGMTGEEVEKYIAQIAFSGAEEFVAKYGGRLALPAGAAGQAQIHELDQRRAGGENRPLRGGGTAHEQQVGRLDVAMHQAAGVKIAQRQRRLPHHLAGQRNGQRAGLRYQTFQIENSDPRIPSPARSGRAGGRRRRSPRCADVPAAPPFPVRPGATPDSGVVGGLSRCPPGQGP